MGHEAQAFMADNAEQNRFITRAKASFTLWFSEGMCCKQGYFRISEVCLPLCPEDFYPLHAAGCKGTAFHAVACCGSSMTLKARRSRRLTR